MLYEFVFNGWLKPHLTWIYRLVHLLNSTTRIHQCIICVNMMYQKMSGHYINIVITLRTHLYWNLKVFLVLIGFCLVSKVISRWEEYQSKLKKKVGYTSQFVLPPFITVTIDVYVFDLLQIFGIFICTSASLARLKQLYPQLGYCYFDCFPIVKSFFEFTQKRYETGLCHFRTRIWLQWETSSLSRNFSTTLHRWLYCYFVLSFYLLEQWPFRLSCLIWCIGTFLILWRSVSAVAMAPGGLPRIAWRSPASQRLLCERNNAILCIECFLLNLDLSVDER